MLEHLSLKSLALFILGVKEIEITLFTSRSLVIHELTEVVLEFFGSAHLEGLLLDTALETENAVDGLSVLVGNTSDVGSLNNLHFLVVDQVDDEVPCLVIHADVWPGLPIPQISWLNPISVVHHIPLKSHLVLQDLLRLICSSSSNISSVNWLAEVKRMATLPWVGSYELLSARLV